MLWTTYQAADNESFQYINVIQLHTAVGTESYAHILFYTMQLKKLVGELWQLWHVVCKTHTVYIVCEVVQI